MCLQRWTGGGSQTTFVSIEDVWRRGMVQPALRFRMVLLAVGGLGREEQPRRPDASVEEGDCLSSANTASSGRDCGSAEATGGKPNP